MSRAASRQARVSLRAMSLPTARAESGLVRAIGMWALAASMVNVVIGGGIFRLPAVVAAALGPAAPLAYLVCSAAMALIALCFAEAGSRVAATGGPYAYVESAFGPFVGFLSGVLLWVLGSLAVAAVATVFAAHVAELVPALSGRLGGAVLLAVLFAALAAVNIRGVRQGTALNTAATVAKLLPLVVLVAVGLAHVDPAALAWTAPPAASAVARTSMILMFAFCGLESALAPSGEVSDPARTVPRAILIATLAVTGLYVTLQVVAQGVLGAALGTSTTPLADVALVLFGPVGRTALLVAAVVSTFGYVSGMTLAVPRALFAFARDGFLPRPVAAVHPRFHTPWVAIAVQSAIACLLAITSTFERLAILANLATVVLYVTCCLAAWQLRRKGVAQGGAPFVAPGGGVAPFVACAVLAGMLTGVHADEWAALGVCLGIASLAFVATRGRRAGV
jgi:APA family basic amino acid/polyamine antiporter